MVEFRLYYDDNGSVICYTSEASVDFPHNYIVIDAFTYAASRYDVRVIDGEIVRFSDATFITKLVPGKGQRCAKEDVMIVVEEYTGETIEWETKTYEYRYR